jgi:hypothetical protein
MKCEIDKQQYYFIQVWNIGSALDIRDIIYKYIDVNMTAEAFILYEYFNI